MPLISLVAMPGGGKSTVGRQLARQLGVPFMDADQEIERRIGKPIRQFFEAQGEDAFRDLEEKLIDELTRVPEGVLATGGGAVLRSNNRTALHERTISLYLRASPEDLIRRLRHDTQRPLLQVADPARKLREMFATRDPLYRQTAHFVIETGRPSVHSLVQMILMQLELAGIVDPSRVPSSVTPPAPAS